MTKQKDDLEQLFFGSSWSKAATLKGRQGQDETIRTAQLDSSRRGQHLARWAMGRRKRKATEQENNMHLIYRTPRRAPPNAIQMASNSIISSDRLTLLAEPKQIEQQQQNIDTNHLLAPTNHRQRETILSNYIPTSSPPQTTTITNNNNNPSSSISDEQSNPIQANKALHVPLIDVNNDGTKDDNASKADFTRLYGTSTCLLFLLVGILVWRCFSTRPSKLCFSGDEWPSVSLLTPKKKKKSSEIIAQVELSTASMHLDKSAHDSRPIELAERPPSQPLDVIQQPTGHKTVGHSIKLVALKRRLAKSSLVLAASAAAKPRVRLLGAQVRKFIDDEARELRERRTGLNQMRPDKSPPSTIAGHLISWLSSIKFTWNERSGAEQDVENNANTNNLQQVRVVLDQYEDKQEDQQEATFEENQEESTNVPGEVSVEASVHHQSDASSVDVHLTEEQQQPPGRLAAQSELCSPFSLVSSTSQTEQAARAVATCGCSLSPGNNPLGRSKSQSGAQSLDWLHLNGGHSQVAPSGQPFRPCCSVSPSSMMANSTSQRHDEHPKQVCQVQGAKCSPASKFGGDHLANRIKRHYENYYDDEHEDAYRRLTASIGMQFGLAFDNHHAPSGATHNQHAHHQLASLHWQPPSTGCRCCPPLAGPFMVAGVRSDGSACRDPVCNLCRQPPPTTTMTPQSSNMSILVQQPSTATPPPPHQMQPEPDRQLDFWPNGAGAADDPNTDRSNGRSSGNGSDQEPSLASSCLTTANSADHLLAANSTACGSAANLLPSQTSYRSSTSPLWSASVSPTNRNVNWSPRRRFNSCKAAGQQQQLQLQQGKYDPPLQTVMMTSSPRRMSIAGDQVRSNNSNSKNNNATVSACHSNQLNPLLHRASIASDETHHLPLVGRPRNLAGNGGHRGHQQQVQQQHSCTSSDIIPDQFQRPSDASLYDADSARYFYCSSSIHRPGIDSNLQSNYGSSLGSSSGIGFSGSQCTNTPTTTTTSVFPFASFGAASGHQQAAEDGHKYCEQQVERVNMHPSHLYNGLVVANRIAASEEAAYFMSTQLLPEDPSTCRQQPQVQSMQASARAPPAQQDPHRHQAQHQLQSLAFSTSRKFSLPVQLESQAADRMSFEGSPVRPTGDGRLLFERNQLEAVDPFAGSNSTEAKRTGHNRQQFKVHNYPHLPGESLRCSQDKQQLRRSSQTITRQSSFWLEDNSLDSVISMSTTQQQSLDESGSILPDEPDKAPPETDQTIEKPADVPIEQAQQPATTATNSNNDNNQQVAFSPTSSSSTNSPREKRLNPFKFTSNSKQTTTTGSRYLAGRARLSSSSSTNSSTPSPDFSRPSERILQLVASKSSSISKRRLFGGRLRARRHARRKSSPQTAPNGPTTSRRVDEIAASRPEGGSGEDENCEKQNKTNKMDQISDTNDTLMSHEREDEFSSLDGDFKNIPTTRPISDLNSASLERQCRDLWKLRATLHDDDSSIADNWTNYHQRLNRRYDSGYKSIENQFSSSLEGNIPLAAAASLQAIAAQQQSGTTSSSRPASGCSGFIAPPTTPGNQPERSKSPAKLTSAVSADQSAEKLTCPSPGHHDDSTTSEPFNHKLKDLSNPLDEISNLSQLNLDDQANSLLERSIDEKTPDERDRCHSRSSGGSSNNDNHHDIT